MHLQTLLHLPSPTKPILLLYFNTILSTLTRRTHFHRCLRTFSLMHSLALPLDSYSLSSAFSASSLPFALLLHALSLKPALLSNGFVSGPLINLYCKSGRIEDAFKVFDEMPVRNGVCVNMILGGCCGVGMYEVGFGVVRQLEGMGLVPDSVTMSVVLRMCGGVPALALGMQAHARVLRFCVEFGRDVVLQSALVEMYGRCGLVDKARVVFEYTNGSTRDVVLWTSMLNAYSRNGLFESVISTFDEMVKEGIRPDDIAFVTVLSACSRIGNVGRGLEHFNLMRNTYKIRPSAEHHGCVMDLLCRGGRVTEAWELANEVAREGGRLGSSVWGALLSACKECGMVEMGRIAADKALQFDPGNVGVYVELCNLYGRVGMWEEIGVIREVMKGLGMKKDVGWSRVEVTTSS